ncbi:MAG: threonylcarbamoyl-AMP synthase [Bacteroidetes bacterium]|jgi:tRNA threonylcarbamoyl adenosine modification protein (Sua5/YciO/YrdC/YwlC family)|nr:threonylcarbamoyl-AMP synthase [Bacteroidota bacterium]MBK6820354.1 threonylcarbamoyl-AMP synthase [Bacteroidota bacterium]MBK7041124.1 threonylcarbamoyl-AMP synthase [Bacteroidota bacterium]MBK7587714.1 threonylcarbamoyl-AMP synthase [Bacteroidota bacterium]MBK8328791.1 threonylcarbamoyl-AMP synthase [Bacteroidota bacterium]
MLMSIHPNNPDERKIKQLVALLKKGGVIIYPTDTVYGMGCDIAHPEAIERICKIKQINPQKAQLSFLCSDLSHLSEYTKAIDTPLYRFLKLYLPGPFTFILEASKKVPKLLRTKKDTVGIRVPDNKICRAILTELGNPILSTSLPFNAEGEILTDAEEINELFENLVDMVVDGGAGGVIPSTIVDCTVSPPEIIREGAGEIV